MTSALYPDNRRAAAAGLIRPQRRSNKTARRGSVIVPVAVMSTVIMGFGAIAIDLGTLYTVQAELQTTADAAALAAAGRLAAPNGIDPRDAAREAAEAAAGRNQANGAPMTLASGDVEFGRATFDGSIDRFSFEPSGSPIDSVRVTARRDSNGSTPVKLMFANIFGNSTANLQARAAATLIPRDMVVVADLSGSMSFDSRLLNFEFLLANDGFSNIRDIWAALDGPRPDFPYIPGEPEYTQYAADLGPTYGHMTEWGDRLDESYSAPSDPGLYHIRRYNSFNDGTLSASLAARGYSPEEQNAIINGSGDNSSGSYENRVKILLGLAEWKSGMEGGKYPPEEGGNGNTNIGDNELTAKIDLPNDLYGSLSWDNWINDQRRRGSQHVNQWNDMKEYYGLKTFVDYLLDNRGRHSHTPILAQTPQQPLQAAKDAVKTMADYIEALDSPDQLSLVIFGTSVPPPEVYLTESLQQVPSRLFDMQATHYDGSTNIGGGLSRAITELKSSRARDVAKKVIVLMSDGVANISDDGAMSPKAYAKALAEQAAEEGMIVYTVSIGYGVDRALMQEIATLGNGQEFYAAGNPEEYSEQLRDIFRSLGGARPVVLIE